MVLKGPNKVKGGCENYSRFNSRQTKKNGSKNKLENEKVPTVDSC